jgi:hypothetical protein
MRKIFAVTLHASLLLLTSCTTVQRAKPLPLQVEGKPVTEMLTISLSQAELLASGYTVGQWVLLEIEGVVLKAQIASSPNAGTTTLVPGEKDSTLYAPLAIREGGTGVMVPYREPADASSSVSFSGSFVFTL